MVSPSQSNVSMHLTSPVWRWAIEQGGGSGELATRKTRSGRPEPACSLQNKERKAGGSRRAPSLCPGILLPSMERCMQQHGRSYDERRRGI
uniref:Uncharacterized protein n=1 Tax=Oryza glumipatula TaxID=40148 RepID=A0A0D9Y9Y7_9ORYZ